MEAGQVASDRFESRVIFSYGGPGPVHDSGRAPCRYAGVRGRNDWSGWMRWRRLVREYAPDIIHYHDPLVVGRAFLLGLPGIRITHCHGRPLAPPRRIEEKLGGWWQRRESDAFISIDNRAASALIDQGLADKDRSFVLGNAIDTAFFDELPTRADARRSLGIPTDARVLAMICRLDVGKGFPDLFRLLQLLPAHWQAVVAGSGRHEEWLESRCRDLGLSERVHFVGALDDVRPVHAAADAYWMASHHEPFGLVLAEAMAAGLPIIGLEGRAEYRQTDPPLIRDELVQFWPRVQPERFDDPEEYHRAEEDAVLAPIAKYLEETDFSSDSWRTRTLAAKRHVRAHFDIARHISELRSIYDTLLEDHHDA